MQTALNAVRRGVLLALIAGIVCLPAISGSAAADPDLLRQVDDRLGAIVAGIPAIAAETHVRRSLAHATFCLPQNVLGILYYALLQATGGVLGVREMNEMTIVVTRTPAGASLGRYVFVSVPLLSERTVRHEYGHAMQGYRHGPFYLLFEGLTSFVQAAVSIVSPSSAQAYFARWPENEADRLGGVE